MPKDGIESNQRLELTTESISISGDTSVAATRKNYGEKYQEHLLEQYKIYVEMVDRVSFRRNQMNSFYITLISGLLALITIITNKDINQFQNVRFQQASFLAISVLGLLLCASWYLNIQSYKNLNSSKFKVICEIEKQLPFACYEKEWNYLKKDKNYQGYLTQTKVERILPIILSIPYIGLFLYSLLSF